MVLAQYLLLSPSQGYLLLHHMTGIEGSVRTLTPFHIPNCEHGFVDYRPQVLAHATHPTHNLQALCLWLPF